MKLNTSNFKELNKLRMAFEQTPGAIFILDKNFRFEYVNPGFEKLSGYTKMELLNKTVSKIFYGEDVLESLKEVVESMLKGEKWQGELLTFNKNGSTYWANTIAAPYKDENGNIEGYIIVQQDINDRKMAQSALLESEAKYKTLVENSQDGIIIVRDNKVIYSNDTICNLLGYCLQGLSAEDIIHSQDIYKVTAIRERRRNHDFSTIHESLRMIAKNGEIKECDTTSTLIQFGGVWASFFTIHDLTESKRIQNSLLESEKKYRELADFLPQTVFELDIDGNLLYVNKSGLEIMGVSNSDMGQSVLRFFVPEDRKRMAENLTKRNRKNKPNAINEYTVLRNDGKRFPVKIYGLSILKDGNPVGTRGIIIDISEQKAMENALRESEKKYRELSEMLPQTVYELDLNANLKYLNKTGREKFGDAYETSDLSVFSIVVPEQVERMKQNFANVSFNNIPSKGNFYKLRQVDGQIFDAMISATAMKVDGKIIGSRGVVVDLTERIRIENELQLAKTELEKLNSQLEKRVKETSKSLTEARTQLISLQKENLQSQYEVLKQQVNPHFLFNSLNVLTSLIKIEPDLAEKFSEQLSKVYRYVLENKDYELVDINTELNFLEAYIFLLNIRFVGKLQVNINIPADKHNEKIIPLALQLLIENAIKHNTMSKLEPLIIDVFVDKDNYLQVINNLQERPSQLASTGLGLKNIMNRYTLLQLPIPVFMKTETQFIAQIPLITKN